MNKLSRKAQITKAMMLLVTLTGLLLSACKPEEIVTTNTQIERDVTSWINESCPKRPDGTCKAIGE